MTPQSTVPPLTEPEPVPAFVTVSVRSATNVAVTERAALIVSVQPPVPEHAPDQPANLEPAAGVALRLTTVPSSRSAAQVEPQSIGPPVTAPEPEPERETVSA